MENYLEDLIEENVDPDEKYIDFLKSYIVSLETLLDIVNILKNKLYIDNLQQFLEPLRFYILLHKPKQSEILTTSHIFCKECSIYTPSSLHFWKQMNSELFETEIYFYFIFFSYFFEIIEMDIDAFTPDHFQKLKKGDELKILSTLIQYYENI